LKLSGRKQVLQNFPEKLLERIDSWGEIEHLSRTDAVNQLCKKALDQETILRLQSEIQELRKKVVSLGMEHVKGGK
jgi:metal-responsive CopG/Arc/MetJ family transcriptional regulator